MSQIAQQIEQLLTEKAKIDRANVSAVNNMASYNIWLVNAVELLLYIAQKQYEPPLEPPTEFRG